MNPALFFITGTGRCGTMTLANALNNEAGVTCTHEGQFRHGDRAGEQVLPFMTLQNRLAYERPGDADALFEEVRGGLPEIAARYGGTHFGDIAYNYAPFLPAIARQFPHARVIVMIRNGLDFVRSATVRTGEDPTPLGWAPPDKPLTAVERFVALGRLAPRADDGAAKRWDALGAAARNAWLWAETNRIILDGLDHFDPERIMVLRFETFFAAPIREYALLRAFLDIEGPVSRATEDVFAQRINSRDTAQDLSPDERAAFDEFAGTMMERLGYG